MLPQRLIFLRRKKGLSQYELAEKLRFSRGKLANYEQGTRQPDYDTLQEIADFFEVSTDYLLSRTGDMRSERGYREKEMDEIFKDSQTIELFDNWKNMSKKEREEVLRMINYIQFKRTIKKESN